MVVRKEDEGESKGLCDLTTTCQDPDYINQTNSNEDDVAGPSDLIFTLTKSPAEGE